MSSQKKAKIGQTQAMKGARPTTHPPLPPTVPSNQPYRASTAFCLTSGKEVDLSINVEKDNRPGWVLLCTIYTTLDIGRRKSRPRSCPLPTPPVQKEGGYCLIYLPLAVQHNTRLPMLSKGRRVSYHNHPPMHTTPATSPTLGKVLQLIPQNIHDYATQYVDYHYVVITQLTPMLWPQQGGSDEG